MSVKPNLKTYLPQNYSGDSPTTTSTIQFVEQNIFTKQNLGLLLPVALYFSLSFWVGGSGHHWFMPK